MTASVRALRARFDTTALRPFDDARPAVAAAPAWPALRAWLDQPAEPGSWPCAPSRQPMLSVACCTGADPVAAFGAATAVGLWLDGSWALRDCRTPAGRLALRLRVKLQDVASALIGRPHGIWDSGYVPDESAAWRALAAFTPRRASFIVVQVPPRTVPAEVPAEVPAPAMHAVHALMANRHRLSCPVRLLVMGAPWPGLQALTLPGPALR